MSLVPYLRNKVYSFPNRTRGSQDSLSFSSKDLRDSVRFFQRCLNKACVLSDEVIPRDFLRVTCDPVQPSTNKISGYYSVESYRCSCTQYPEGTNRKRNMKNQQSFFMPYCVPHFPFISLSSFFFSIRDLPAGERGEPHHDVSKNLKFFMFPLWVFLCLSFTTYEQLYNCNPIHKTCLSLIQCGTEFDTIPIHIGNFLKNSVSVFLSLSPQPLDTNIFGIKLCN